MSARQELKDTTMALFFTKGMSMKKWHDSGMIDREVALYNELAKHYKAIYFFTYGVADDLDYRSYLADNIVVYPKKSVRNDLLYSFLLPLIHRRALGEASILKTNQMRGSWSAVLTKLLLGKKLVVRTGYTLSSFSDGRRKSKKLWLYRLMERIAYRWPDCVIVTSQSDLDHVVNSYNLKCTSTCLPNYVETDIFKRISIQRKPGSVSFVGRLTPQKNLFSLLEALKGSEYSLTIIGSGEQEEALKKFAEENGICVNFTGNVPNHRLPELLNGHEVFILPSLYEGMPKTLLEAMSCGMPVIGTDVKGINEVIVNGVNGILCGTDPVSIRKAIDDVMKDGSLKKRLGDNARKTILEYYSLDSIVRRESGLMESIL